MILNKLGISKKINGIWRFNRLNPLTWIFLFLSALIIPFFAMFSSQTSVMEQYKYLYQIVRFGRFGL